MAFPNLVDVTRVKESMQMDAPKKKNKFIRVHKLSDEKKAKLALTLTGEGAHGMASDSKTSHLSHRRTAKEIRGAMYGKEK